MPSENRPPADTEVLARLRQTYPHWGILSDGKGTWTAIRGTGPDIVKGHPAALRDAIDADSRNTPGGAPHTAHGG